jgi:hypothetical protein
VTDGRHPTLSAWCGTARRRDTSCGGTPTIGGLHQIGRFDRIYDADPGQAIPRSSDSIYATAGANAEDRMMAARPVGVGGMLPGRAGRSAKSE